MGKIKVAGYAQTKLSVDKTLFTISFTQKDYDEAVAIERVHRYCDAFLAKLKEKGMDLKNVHLENDHISSRYNEANMKECTREITLTTEASAKNNNFIYDLIKENNIKAEVRSRSFCSDKKETRKKLLEEAVKDSREKAEIIASASGSRVIGIDYLSFDRNEFDDDIHHMVVYSNCLSDISEHISSEISNAEEIESEEVFITWNID